MYDISRVEEAFKRLMLQVRDELEYHHKRKFIDSKSMAQVLESLMDDALKLAFEVPLREQQLELEKAKQKEEIAILKIQAERAQEELNRYKIDAPKKSLQLDKQNELLAKQSSKEDAEKSLINARTATETNQASLVAEQINKVKKEEALLASEASLNVKKESALNSEISLNNERVSDMKNRRPYEIALLDEQRRTECTKAAEMLQNANLIKQKKRVAIEEVRVQQANVEKIKKDIMATDAQIISIKNKEKIDKAIANANIAKNEAETKTLISKIATDDMQRKVLGAQAGLIEEQAKGIPVASEIRAAEVRAKVYAAHIAANGIDNLESNWRIAPSISTPSSVTTYVPSSVDFSSISFSNVETLDDIDTGQSVNIDDGLSVKEGDIRISCTNVDTQDGSQ